VIDITSLAWFAVYGAAILGIGLALRQVARWSEGLDLADLVGGYGDPPWPRGVQEEEPVRWHMEALGRRLDQPDTGPTRMGNDHPPVQRIGTRQTCPPPA
jgi:hypothetical protein